MEDTISIKDTRQSPKDWDTYLKGNLSLSEIVEDQQRLLTAQAVLLQEERTEFVDQELVTVTDWLQQTTTLLLDRLQTQAA